MIKETTCCINNMKFSIISSLTLLCKHPLSTQLDLNSIQEVLMRIINAITEENPFIQEQAAQILEADQVKPCDS
ncbi:MAG: hypothetical protein PG981_001459 [Wolbachia endosymbiont of Ctenocephalides orientis wCori]|nr:MAG: hypothetical protein PG981_001459 [Wolbachia endosymbiont of Ctenocephalides orientis wCori]